MFNSTTHPIAIKKRFIALAVWLVFTVSLVTWLYIFTAQQLKQIQTLSPEHSAQLIRYHRMLILEALTMFFCLLVGAMTIAYFIYREIKQSNQIKNFFMALSHELKTSIASVQLQIESLIDSKSYSVDSLQFLQKDLNRLTFQLENSLFLAGNDANNLFIQAISINEALRNLSYTLPDLKIESPTQDIWISADARALHSILLNIGFNCLKHGKASMLQVTAKPINSYWELCFYDNGTGFYGERANLGQFLTRTSANSGSGIGLYLVKTLATKLKGSVKFPETVNGFKIILSLPKTCQSSC